MILIICKLLFLLIDVYMYVEGFVQVCEVCWLELVEDYVELIVDFIVDGCEVWQVDIVMCLGVVQFMVVKVFKWLVKEGWVIQWLYWGVFLILAGEQFVVEMWVCYQMVECFLLVLGVDVDLVWCDVEGIEYYVSEVMLVVFEVFLCKVECCG